MTDSQSVFIPGTKVGVPPLPGLAFRVYRGSSDVAALRAVHDGCRDADAVDPFSVCYRIPNLSPSDYQKDVEKSFKDGQKDTVLLAEIAGRVIGHSRIEWWSEWDSERQASKYAYLIRGWVLPEWRVKGIGSALLHWGEERARQIDQVQSQVPSELATNASDGEQDSIALLENEGYKLRFLSPELGRDLDGLPPLAVPPGFSVRPLEMRYARAVAHALLEANADPTWTREQLQARIKREEAQWTEFVESCDPLISAIGWHNGAVAGLHVCRRSGSVGDVANVAVRPAYRLQGLARSLMFHCLHAMRADGLQTARLYTGIGTNRDAPPGGPLRMYLGFGFRIVAFHNRYRKPF